MQQQVEDEINRLIDIPNIDEEHEGYAIHLIISLLVFILYCLLKLI